MSTRIQLIGLLVSTLSAALAGACSESAADRDAKVRPCIEKDIPRMEMVLRDAVAEVDPAWTLEKNKPFLDEIVSQSGDLAVSLEVPGSLDTLTYRIFNSCDLEFQFELVLRTIADSEVSSVRTGAISPPDWYDIAWLQEMNRDF